MSISSLSTQYSIVRSEGPLQEVAIATLLQATLSAFLSHDASDVRRIVAESRRAWLLRGSVPTALRDGRSHLTSANAQHSSPCPRCQARLIEAPCLCQTRACTRPLWSRVLGEGNHHEQAGSPTAVDACPREHALQVRDLSRTASPKNALVAVYRLRRMLTPFRRFER